MSYKIQKCFQRAVFLPVLLLLLQSPASALENVRVAYPSLSSTMFYLLIAQKEGYYKQEGLNVEILNIRGEIGIRTALAGEIDFVTNAGSSLVAGIRAVPIKIVIVCQDRPSWELIAQPQIKSIAQLKGGNVAIMSPEGSLAVATREMLRKNGVDPAKEANLIIMGGDDVRFMALKGKAIQATLMNPATSFLAQKDGFTRLASAGDYVNYVQGGVATTDEKIKQNPARIFKFIRASLKGLSYFMSKRESSINYMMDIMKYKDRELASAIYDYDTKFLLRDGVSPDKKLQGIIDDARKAIGVKKEFKVNDIFDLSFARKASEELKANGWKP